MLGDTPAVTQDDLSELCLSCGMCCDGTLYSQVTLSHDETDTLQQCGIGIQVNDVGIDILPHPCAALLGTSCTVYTHRPQTCRKFRCRILRRIMDHDLTLIEGKQIINSACALRNELTKELGGKMVISDLRKQTAELNDDWPGLDRETRRTMAPLMLRFTALENLLVTEIRPREEAEQTS